MSRSESGSFRTAAGARGVSERFGGSCARARTTCHVTVSREYWQIWPIILSSAFTASIRLEIGSSQRATGRSRFRSDLGSCLTQIESAIDAGIAGIGLIRVFSYHVRPAFRAGMLREVLSDFAPPSVPVHILHGTDDMVPLKVRAFYRLLRAAPTSTLTR
jgi:DNA-binding transcriptional LysR family regulator